MNPFCYIQGTGLYMCSNSGSNDCYWSAKDDCVYLIGSNVGIGTSDAKFPLDVVGSVRATQDIFADIAAFNNLVSTNAVIHNYQGRNMIVDNARLNNLQVSSITLNNSIGKQVLNTIQSTSSNNTCSLTISWDNVNHTYQNNMLVIDLVTQVSTSSSSVTRTSRFDINTYVPVAVTQHNPTGYGDITLITSISEAYTTGNDLVKFTVSSTASDIQSFNLSLNIISYNDIIGRIYLS
jgi:hypothetical protein